jgi:hypothetical protein
MMLSERKRPGSHTHICTTLEWTGEVVLDGHFMQWIGLGAAGVTEKVLTVQSVHTEACSSENEPVLHGAQAAMLDAARRGDAVPAGHLLQVCPPVGEVAE